MGNNRAHFRLFPLPGLFLGLLLIGCARHPYTPGPRLADQSAATRFAARLDQTYPPQFELTQRVTLFILGKRYDMLGFLLYQKHGGFRAIATGEMGGKIFDFLADGSGPRILKKPKTLPPRPLLHGALRDIGHLFDWTPGDNAYLTEREDGRMGLVVPLGDDHLQEYVFDAYEQLTRSLESMGGKVVREATYEAFHEFKGWSKSIPKRIRLVDYEWHFSMDIETIKIHPLTGKVDLLR